jgi:hypothetical protein
LLTFFSFPVLLSSFPFSFVCLFASESMCLVSHTHGIPASGSESREANLRIQTFQPVCLSSGDDWQQWTAHTASFSIASCLLLVHRVSMGKDTTEPRSLPTGSEPASSLQSTHMSLSATPGLYLRCLRQNLWIWNNLILPDWKINSVNFNWQLILNLKHRINECIVLVLLNVRKGEEREGTKEGRKEGRKGGSWSSKELRILEPSLRARHLALLCFPSNFANTWRITISQRMRLTLRCWIPV